MSCESESPGLPRFAVIFTSLRTVADQEGYAKMARQMEDLVRQQPGFLGFESAREADGWGITVSYWESLEAIRKWREHAEHREAQDRGRKEWYQEFRLRICRVESETRFVSETAS